MSLIAVCSSPYPMSIPKKTSGSNFGFLISNSAPIRVKRSPIERKRAETIMKDLCLILFFWLLNCKKGKKEGSTSCLDLLVGCIFKKHPYEEDKRPFLVSLSSFNLKKISSF